MTERERIAALEEQIDVLADRLRGIGITAERDVERALAALGKRNRPPVDGQGGMTIDKGVGGEAAKPRGRPPINDEGGTATTKGSGDFLRWEREGWVHHATRMANERDEARAERDELLKRNAELEEMRDALDNALQAIMDVFTLSGDGATSDVQDTLPTACATHTASVDTAHRRGV